MFFGPLEVLVVAQHEHRPRHSFPGPSHLPIQLDEPLDALLGSFLAETRIACESTE